MVPAGKKKVRGRIGQVLDQRGMHDVAEVDDARQGAVLRDQRIVGMDIAMDDLAAQARQTRNGAGPVRIEDVEGKGPVIRRQAIGMRREIARSTLTAG